MSTYCKISTIFRVGELITTTTDDGKHTDIQIEKIISHPKYSNSTKNNDIALLKLASPAPYGQHVQPICLPEQDRDVPIGTDCYVTGIQLRTQLFEVLLYWIFCFRITSNFPKENEGLEQQHRKIF